MKTSFHAPKNLCQNGSFSVKKNDICFGRRKSPCIAAVWGRLRTGNSDKESSHVVGKFFDSGV